MILLLLQSTLFSIALYTSVAFVNKTLSIFLAKSDSFKIELSEKAATLMNISVVLWTLFFILIKL